MINNRRGSALILSYAVVMILTIMGTGIVGRNVTESLMTRRFDYSTRAFWLAEAGINRAIYELNSGGGSWTGWSGTNPKTLAVSWGSFGYFSVSVTDPASNAPSITATGSYPSATDPARMQRSLNAVLQRSGSVFSYAAFGRNSLTMSGNAVTDSYNSAEGPYDPDNPGSNGDAGTNGDITGNGGNYHIGGDAFTGDTGVFNEPSHVDGEIYHTSNISYVPVEVPENLAVLASGGTISSTLTLPPDNYRYTAISLAGKNTLTINGPANVYLTGVTSISLAGQAGVVVNGEVNFYVDGSVSLSGQGIVNNNQDPRDLIIYGTSSAGSFSVSGNGDFYGVVYSPNSALHLSGNGKLFGSFIGDRVAISGNGGVHYDEALGTMATSAGAYSIRSWKENQNPRSVN